jgi:ABC-type phosphate transport system substrate-binding protein
MKKLIFLFILLSICSFANGAFAKSIAVIVHAENPTETLTKKQLIDLYIGRYVAFSDKQVAQPLDTFKPENLRTLFYKRLVNMPLSRVNAYWSRVRFTGRATPPEIQQSEQAVLESVANNPSAIGYVFSESLTLQNKQGIKIIMELYE